MVLTEHLPKVVNDHVMFSTPPICKYARSLFFLGK